MTYNEWLEKELNIYKRENKLLKDKYEKLTTMFNEVNDNELETKEKKKQILKWAYSLEKENKKLKEQIDYADYLKATLFNDREEYKNKIVELKRENKRLIKKCNKSIKTNIDLYNLKVKLLEENKKLDDENTKLEDDLSLSKRVINIQSCELYELKEELKEYRGF